MIKVETLRDNRRVVFKMDFRGPDQTTYAQVLDSHIEALDVIDRVRALATELEGLGEHHATVIAADIRRALEKK